MNDGSRKGDIHEYLEIKHSDINDCLSYERKLRIDYPTESVLHNEIGYVTHEMFNIMTSLGGYLPLKWNSVSERYCQMYESSFIKGISRKVVFPNSAMMIWDSRSKIINGRDWVTHNAYVEFFLVSR